MTGISQSAYREAVKLGGLSFVCRPCRDSEIAPPTLELSVIEQVSMNYISNPVSNVLGSWNEFVSGLKTYNLVLKGNVMSKMHSNQYTHACQEDNRHMYILTIIQKH